MIAIKSILASTLLTGSLVAGGLTIGTQTFNTATDGKKEYTINISDVDPLNLEIDDALKVLKDHGGDANNRICLKINSYGGEVRLMYELLNEIDNAKAEIVGIANGFVMSAGGPLVLSGDKIKFSKHSLFLIHKARYHNEAGEIVIGDEYQHKVMNNVIASYYQGLLTKSEYDRFMEGEDVFIDGKEIEHRVKLVDKDRIASDNVCR